MEVVGLLNLKYYPHMGQEHPGIACVDPRLQEVPLMCTGSFHDIGQSNNRLLIMIEIELLRCPADDSLE